MFGVTRSQLDSYALIQAPTIDEIGVGRVEVGELAGHDTASDYRFDVGPDGDSAAAIRFHRIDHKIL